MTPTIISLRSKIRQIPTNLNATALQALGQLLLAYAREQRQDPFGRHVEEFVEECAKTLVFHIE